MLALDQGTSSSRALVFDQWGRVGAAAQRIVDSSYPQPGWVEQSPQALWQSQLDAAREAVRQVGVSNVRAIAIANQRETSLIWHRETLEPIGPAIVWQCRRTAQVCEELAQSHGPEIRDRTGLQPDAYFSGPKFAWLLDQVNGARDLAEAGLLACGTVDAWLLANLTGGISHATDVTNASRTMLWNLVENRWDEQLCAWQRVRIPTLPEVKPSAGEFGFTDESLFGERLPILAIAGDQQAALFGHGITGPGSAKCTYGTGAFLLSHAGDAPSTASIPEGVVLTATADGRFAYEGGIFTAGSAIQWLRDELRLAPSAADISQLAASTESSEGVMMIPALTGLGSPHWDPDARGAILGITRGTTPAQLARAALESVAFRVREIVEAMDSGGAPIDELRVDGGMTSSDVLMQIQANALQRPIVRPAVQETTALGVARLAMNVAGIKPEIEINERRFEPNADLHSKFERWSAARRAVQSIPPAE
ncbi:MAG: glycerol kinase GlpK [Chloroflexi bacterium]|nr:glycerol kinase GlpK [Chloroflexota bacterium]MCY3587271.1 glycerol kinase GlpK [Chloroflexota bacterium]MCY3686634.1 glycerol kinase GlpK [Chloroflexota bacterium]MDE2709178.1 glycerol kinase GlpK [Chloroflexota bacterium]